MLYRFKSRATGDLVMLEPSGKRVLEILGKDPAGPGIITPEQMPAAVAALREAVHADDAERERLAREAQARDEAPPDLTEAVSLRMRVAPFIDMLQHCMREEVEVVWGV